jgi:hypothetical protein
LPENAGRGGIGTPGQLREHLSRYEKAGIDQVMFVQQSGANRHEHNLRVAGDARLQGTRAGSGCAKTA